MSAPLIKIRNLHWWRTSSEHSVTLQIEGVGELETKVKLSDKLIQQIQDEILAQFTESPKAASLNNILRLRK